MRKLFKAIIVTVLMATPGHAFSQAAFEVEPTQAIPKKDLDTGENYESWSLFLICSPEWVLENGDSGIAELFEAYRVFGRAIGRKNLAIWFWRTPAFEPTVENSDIERMAEYCAKYELIPACGRSDS